MSTSREQLLEASQRVRAFHERQQAEYIIEDHDDPDQKQLTEDSLMVVKGLRELLAELDAKCRWRRHKELGSKLPLWFTECGEQSVGVFKHCPHCGKEIVSE